MSHYETLGVKEDATDADLKRAYRQKATEHHPDKGGDARDFAEVAQAYETLKDPQRRQLYDATGQDRQTPIEQEVQSVLVQFFSEALQSPSDISILGFARSKVKDGARRMNAQRKEMNARRKKLEIKRIKVTSKGDVNLFHAVIDKEIQNIDATIAQLDHQKEIGELLSKAIDEYEEDWKVPKSPSYSLTDSFNLSGGSVLNINDLLR